MGTSDCWFYSRNNTCKFICNGRPMGWCEFRLFIAGLIVGYWVHEGILGGLWNATVAGAFGAIVLAILFIIAGTIFGGLAGLAAGLVTNIISMGIGGAIGGLISGSD